MKWSTIINDIQNGGLKMPDIYTVHATQKLAWMKRLLDNSTKKWKVLSFSLICLPKDYIDFKLPIDRYHTAKTQFYQQLLNCWFSIKNKKPTTVDEILNEYLFYNRFILVNKSCLELSIVDNNKRLLQTKMIDLIKLDSSLLNFQDMSTKFSSQLTLMQYYSIIKAIPPNWKSKLKLFNPTYHEKKNYVISLSIEKVLKPINMLDNNNIYWEIIHSKSEPPTSLETWINLYPFLETVDWKPIFTLVYNVTVETYLQTFQFKTLHRTLNCKYNMFNWKKAETPMCSYCETEVVDTLEHHLFYCIESRKFWSKIEQWITDNLGLQFKFTVCEILLRIIFTQDDTLHIII